MSKPIECTIPELVEKCANIDRIAAIFDSEKETYTFGKIYNEVELQLALTIQPTDFFVIQLI